MTRLQAVGVLLVALGLIYGLLYVAWLRKQRRHTSAAVATWRVIGTAGTPPIPAIAQNATGATTAARRRSVCSRAAARATAAAGLCAPT